MTQAAPTAIAISRVLDDIMRHERGRLLAGLIARTGDFQMAEDMLQEASVSALKHWSRNGLPDDPVAWLFRVAMNKSIDAFRSRQRDTRKTSEASIFMPESPEPLDTYPDERLRLIFTCCHPALDEKSRVALTLRTVCNLTTREIAAAFLDNEATMGQRLSRAKSKIRNKGISFRVPDATEWPERLNTVLSTLYLIFTTGYVTTDTSPRDLCAEGIYLARLLSHLRPDDPEIGGVLALMMLTEARKSARTDERDALIPIEQQNAHSWDRHAINEAQEILAAAIARQSPGPFQIKAAIADCHMMRPEPDWEQMSLLYGSLWRFEPTSVVALNWAVVMAETGRLDLAVDQINRLGDKLSGFRPWHAARAFVLNKLGRVKEATDEYQTAAKLAPTAAARLYLEQQIGHLQRS